MQITRFRFLQFTNHLKQNPQPHTLYLRPLTKHKLPSLDADFQNTIYSVITYPLKTDTSDALQQCSLYEYPYNLCTAPECSCLCAHPPNHNMKYDKNKIKKPNKSGL